jgi:NitT/TauT family transport system substrate-binding protein
MVFMPGHINIMVLRHAAFYSPLLATLGGGFLNDEGFEYSYRIATPDNSVEQGIAEGRIQLAQSAVATSFAPLARGEQPPFIHFAQINERDGFFLVGRQASDHFDWSDLVGQEVLVDHFFQPLAMFRYALHRQGIEESAISVIDAGDVSAIEQAFRQGQGSYAHMQGPVPQQLEKDGLGQVVAAVGDVVGPVAFSSLCAAPEWLQTDEALAFMNAYRKGQQFVLDEPASTVADAIADFFPAIDRDVLEATIAAYQQLGCWQREARISHDSYERLLDVFDYSGQLARRFAYEEVIVSPPDEAGV